jgi:hypothetical protein
MECNWNEWERCILLNGIHIDRPKGCCHPRYPNMTY